MYLIFLHILFSRLSSFVFLFFTFFFLIFWPLICSLLRLSFRSFLYYPLSLILSFISPSPIVPPSPSSSPNASLLLYSSSFISFVFPLFFFSHPFFHFLCVHPAHFLLPSFFVGTFSRLLISSQHRQPTKRLTLN